MANFEANYYSEDGLARLDAFPLDDHPPFIGQRKRSVANQNGIMYLAEILYEAMAQGWDIDKYEDRVIETLDSLRIENTFCYERRPGDRSLMDSHDNMLGIILLCQIYDFTEEIEGIVDWGRKHSWSYNNLKPREFDFRSWRQGKDVCLYQLANGESPSLVNNAWLWGSAFVGDIRLKKMRMESSAWSFSYYKTPSAQTAHTFLQLGYQFLGGDKGMLATVKDYYKDPNQPYRQLIELRLG